MRLIIYSEGRAEELPLEGTMVLGRSSQCAMRFNDSRISSKHVQFVVDGNTVKVKDLGSTNGTLVNDKKISSEVELKDGDSIKLGKVSIVYSSGQLTPAEKPEESRILAVVGDEYREDEATPVDEDFVPTDEEEEGEAKPELVAREGKWFLREGMEGREVEIIPVRKGVPIEMGNAAGTFRRIVYRNSLLSAAVILVIGALVVAGLVSVFTGPAPKPGDWSFEKYAAAVRRAMTEFDAGEYNRAEYFLSIAARKHADNTTAKLLRDVVSVWKDERQRGNLRAAERVLGALGKYSGKDFPDVRRWSAEMLKQIRRDHEEEAVIAAARDFVASGQIDQALELLGKVTEDSEHYQDARRMITELSGTLYQSFIELAKDAMVKEEWGTARTYLVKAQQKGAPEELVGDDLATCHRNQRDKERLTRAESDFRANRPDAALSSLALVNTNSPYFKEAQALRAEIKRKQVVLDAQRFYRFGDSGGALAALQSQNDSASKALRDKIKSVRGLFDTAERLIRDQKLNEAIAEWNKILQLEPDTENFYHKEAKRLLAEWDTPEQRIKLLENRLLMMQAQNDYKGVIKLLTEIKEIDPNSPLYASRIKEIKQEAFSTFQRALSIKDGDPERALPLFQKVVDMLPAEDPYRETARKEIKLLENNLKHGRR